MSAGRTPGPWSLDQYHNVVGTDGQEIRAIGLVLTSGGEAKANSCLISAAPELLAACAALLRYDGMTDSDGMAFMKAYADAVRLASAAVTKATGGMS